ncbi:MAG: hypothetical protein ACOYMA_05120 [Bacteroidia bacterium]
MKIVDIFAPHLFAFHYKNEKENELSRLLNLWNNPIWLTEFILQHKADIGNIDYDDLIENLIDDANEIDDIINEGATKGGMSLDDFFKTLDNLEYKQIPLSRRKGRKNYLRLYALKIENNCYVITGGGIKFEKVHKMQDRPHLNQELIKFEKCKAFLKENGVSDYDSFYEFLNEKL